MPKAYFIGLGGSGLKTVAALQSKLSREENYRTDYMFSYFDTDSSTVDKINAQNRIIDELTDFLNLGATVPMAIYYNAKQSGEEKHKRFLEWCIDQSKENSFQLPNSNLKDGAGAQRMTGRTAFFDNNSKIVSHIRARLAQFQRLESGDGDVVAPNIYVFASSNGGTGSSMTLDVLYLINKLCVKEGNQAVPNLKLVLFMPQPFISKNDDNKSYKLNAYSYMWELNAFKMYAVRHNGDDILKHFTAIPYDFTNNTFDLFKYVIPVDVETNRDFTLDQLDDLYPTVAEMVYYLEKGMGEGGTATMVSNMSNDVKTIFEHTEPGSYADSPFNWENFLIPMGYRAIRKANVELKEYVQTRGKYEILKYGLLGEEMTDDKDERDKAKKDFAKTYVLPYLIRIDSVFEDAQLDDRCLQNAISETYDSFRFSNELTAAKINNYIEQIESLSVELNAIVKEKKQLLERRIAEGVSMSISNYGLRYVYTLLDLVDDFYLQPMIQDNGALKVQLSASQSKVNDCRKNLRDFTLNRRNQSVGLDYLRKYRDAVRDYQCVKIAIELINDLTIYPGGYLENLRKGDNGKLGLSKIIEKLSNEVEKASLAYADLAKKFRNTASDALTSYLPNLCDIASGDNSDWKEGNLFDKLYCSSIIDFDHDAYKGAFKRRIPVRKNEGSNNLQYYIQQIDKENDLFVSMAFADDERFVETFSRMVLTPLNGVVEKMVHVPDSSLSKWLNQDLRTYFAETDTDVSKLCNIGTIPVLYPITQGTSDAHQTKVLYVGSNVELAQTLGFEDANNRQFVKDESLTDRFLIFKMPEGYNFHSYKHFKDIERCYLENYEEIKRGRYGCHIHKDFALLDLDKAKEAASIPRRKMMLEGFFNLLYYQQVIFELKETHKDAYDLLFDQFNFDFFDTSVKPEDSDGIDWGDDETNQSTVNSETLDGGWGDSLKDTFIEVLLNKSDAKQFVGIRLLEVKKGNEDYSIKIEGTNELKFVVRQSAARISAFADALIELILQKCIENVKVIKNAIHSNSTISDAVTAVSNAAKGKLSPASSHALAPVLKKWVTDKLPQDVQYLEVVKQILR